MGNKGLALLLILTITSSSLSLFVAQTAFAQTSTPIPTFTPAPTPNVPQFSLSFVNNSYFLPQTITNTTNPYTNQTISASFGGYFVKNYTIEIMIKTQPSLPTINGASTEVYFNVRAKGHFEENWSDLNIPSDDENVIDEYWLGYLPPQQNSDYTVLSEQANTYPDGGQVDFQVRAILGYTTFYHDNYYPYYHSDFVYQSSQWSPTQTISIVEGSTSSSINSSPYSSLITTSTSPNATPSAPEFPALAVLPMLMVVLSFAIVLKRLKSLKFKN